MWRPARLPGFVLLTALVSFQRVGRRRKNQRSDQLVRRWLAVLIAAAVTLTAGVAAVVAATSDSPGAPSRPSSPSADASSSAASADAPPSRATGTEAASGPDDTAVAERQAGRQRRSVTTQTARPVVPEVGPGTFRIAPPLSRLAARDPLGGPPASGSGSRRSASSAVVTYRVEVEDTLPWSPRRFASAAVTTLTHQAGWQADGAHILQRVGPPATAQLRVLLATPGTVDALCAPLKTRGRLSCRNGNRVVINAWRWVHGAPGYDGDLVGYRRYVVNHEFGHALGMPHVTCPRRGALAPVMLQQTKGLDGCRPNPWPARVDLRTGPVPSHSTDPTAGPRP